MDHWNMGPICMDYLAYCNWHVIQGMNGIIAQLSSIIYYLLIFLVLTTLQIKMFHWQKKVALVMKKAGAKGQIMMIAFL